jgi:hypothetical protein
MDRIMLPLFRAGAPLCRTGLLTCLFALATLASVNGAEPGVRWRNIVRTKLPQDVSAVALEYTILQVKDGQERPIDPNTHAFEVGDQFLIRIEAKDDMYIYIFTEGPKGDKSCLQPTDQEKPPTVKKGEKIELPGDGYFEFAPPPGEEKFIVVATTEPSKDLAALANVVFRKPDQLLTPAEQEQKSKLLGEYRQKLESTQREKIAGAKTRGVLKADKVEAFSKELKVKGRGIVEEPPHGDETSTFAMAVSTPQKGKPELLISISLKSSATAAKAGR